MDPTLILASASPRRRELMELTGLPYRAVTAETEEIKAGEPEELVRQNARRKAQCVHDSHPGCVVIGADTVVYLEGRVLGKPRDPEEARAMLSSLAGRWHTVYTGVCVIDETGREETQCDQSRVKLAPLEDQVIRRYVASGEPMDKAGAYALQGRAAMFVERIEGSYSNVIGLPMALLRDMLRRTGMDI